MQSLSKLQWHLFTEILKSSKIHMKTQKIQMAKAIMRKNKAGNITLSDFKIVWQWHKNRQTNGMELRAQK